jgi:hypothetical protein
LLKSNLKLDSLTLPQQEVRHATTCERHRHVLLLDTRNDLTDLVELVGIEPTTYGLQSRRSPS